MLFSTKWDLWHKVDGSMISICFLAKGVKSLLFLLQHKQQTFGATLPDKGMILLTIQLVEKKVSMFVEKAWHLVPFVHDGCELAVACWFHALHQFHCMFKCKMFINLRTMASASSDCFVACNCGQQWLLMVTWCSFSTERSCFLLMAICQHWMSDCTFSLFCSFLL